LGPRGKTLAWRARYLAYGIFVPQALLLAPVLLAVGVWPLSIPVWAIGIPAVTTTAIMWSIDHDRSLRSWIQAMRSEITAPRPRRPQRGQRVSPTFTVRTFL